jgi:hypothetical protein
MSDRRSFLFSPFAFAVLSLAFPGVGVRAQETQTHRPIPSVLADVLSYDSDGALKLKKNGELVAEAPSADKYLLSRMVSTPTGTDTGLVLDFHDPELNGTVSYGTYMDKLKYPTIVFLPRPVPMTNGVATIDIKKSLSGSNDVYHMLDSGNGILGYRVLTASGKIIYEGRVAFSGKGPYQVVPTIIEGPLVNMPAPTSVVVSYETSVPVKTTISVEGKTFADESATTHHEIAVTGLMPDKSYSYIVKYGDRSEKHELRTALADGSRKPFSFAFTGCTRSIIAGGERDFTGVNYQTTRSAMASAVDRKVAFVQEFGSQTTGGNSSSDGHLLELANYKRALEPFWATTPVYQMVGDHEWNKAGFAADSVSRRATGVDQFPYATESGEATFAKAFVSPTNGPDSEDGASYDPNPNTPGDFPTYKKNVYSYTYGNLGMIVLNSEYWKSPDPKISGSIEGYVMDQQLKWLEEQVQKFEKDPKIDHVFINMHSAMFPNGDHADAGMWYSGNNAKRPNVMGLPSDKGIIERRDQIIDVAINHSKKVIGFLAGSEHNFSLLEVTPELNIYPDGYTPAKLKLKRKFFFVQSGGGGTYPYSLMNNNPWVDKFQFFSVMNSIAIMHINGPSVTLEAYNPETFEKICEDVKLR